MRCYEQQTPFREAHRTTDVNCPQSPPVTPTVTSYCTRQPSPPASSVSQWTPRSIAELGIRWSVLESNVAIIVRSRPCGHVYALSVSADTTTSNSKGWRLYKDGSRVLLVPTTATRSKTHWLLDTEQSTDILLVWRQAGKQMRWIPSPGTFRPSTLRDRSDRLVAPLDGAPSPPAPKRGKIALKDNDGCHCSIGTKFSLDPFTYTMHTLTHMHTQTHTHTCTQHR